MARGRMLSRTLGSSRRFNAVGDVAGDLAEFAQLLFTLLVPHTDDFGRMAGDAYTVKLTVFPGSSRKLPEFLEALRALHEVKLITVYEAEDTIWLQVSKFEPHQIGLHKRTKSLIPEWPGNSRKFPEVPAQVNLRELNLREGNLREENRREDRGEAAALSQVSTNEDGPTAATKGSAADAARSNGSGERTPEENLRVITKIAHEAIDNYSSKDDLAEIVKAVCAQNHIAYDTATVRKALDSAEAQRKVAR